jgi:hypothetical protein
MSYQTVKDGVAGILRGLRYSESAQTKDFTGAPTSEYSNTFILNCLSGKQTGANHNTGFYDTQSWTVQVAFERSANSDTINLEDVHRAKDTILPALDDADNWRGFVKLLKYSEWTLVENPNFFLLTITFIVVDSYTH